MNPVADLSITKSDSPDPVSSGQQLTYTIGVHNSGPSGATGVTVTDTLPGGVTYNSATPSQGSCSHSSGTVTCNLGAVANGANATVDHHGHPHLGNLHHEPGERVRGHRRPGPGQQRGQRDRRRSIRSPTCR